MNDGFDDYEVVEDPLGEDAAEDSDRRIKPFPNPDLELCPVVPLGFEGARVVFAMPEGEIRKELASKIGQMLRTDIFACQAGLAFLTHWRDDAEDKFQRDLATIWFVRQCRAAGVWDSSRPVRSLGLWPDTGGRIVLHLGDEVWRLEEGKKAQRLPIIKALREPKGPLYKLRPPAPRPRKPATVEDGQWVRAGFDRWRFKPIGREGLSGADVAAGWTMASMLGAVPPFRGHLLVNAMLGSGKTTLVEYVQALQSAIGGEVIDSFTEAGLRNELSGYARPVLLDEAESSSGIHGPGAVERALEVLRRMATGSGGNRKQGDLSGGSVTQTAVGAVMLAAINPPKLAPQDASRFVEVRLLPLDGADLPQEVPRPPRATRAELRAMIDKARELAPALLGRAFYGAWRYLADVEAIAEALGRAGEKNPRTGDLIAMLAAGRRLLLFDQALTPEEADAEVAFWKPLLVQREAADLAGNPGAEALAHLMAADSGQRVHERQRSLGELIQRNLSSHERGAYDETLKAHGLKIQVGPSPDRRPGPWLVVANHHPKLEQIFRNTPWADWRRSLEYLDGLGPDYETWPTPNSERFGTGVKVRALCIPLAPWLEKPTTVGGSAPA